MSNRPIKQGEKVHKGKKNVLEESVDSAILSYIPCAYIKVLTIDWDLQHFLTKWCWLSSTLVQFGSWFSCAHIVTLSLLLVTVWNSQRNKFCFTGKLQSWGNNTSFWQSVVSNVCTWLFGTFLIRGTYLDVEKAREFWRCEDASLFGKYHVPYTWYYTTTMAQWKTKDYIWSCWRNSNRYASISLYV